jgi:CHAD domain-containing protein
MATDPADKANAAVTIVPPASPALEFVLAPADIARLLRAPALVARRTGRVKSAAVTTIWHDTSDGALAENGLSLSETRGLWRLECLSPGAGAAWLPATPAPVLAEAASPEALPGRLLSRTQGAALAPVAAFTARQRDVALQDPSGPARLVVLEGTMRGVVQDRAACRLILFGEPRAMADLAVELASQIPLLVPSAGLAAEAISVARGVPPGPRRLGAPAVPQGATIGEALGAITAHLADVILYWATQIPGAATPEPVHQMRVAVRRLRSALSVFRRAVPTPSAWLEDLAPPLKSLAAELGAARDWDVFLAETGAEVRQALPADPRIGALIAASARKRAAAYAGLCAKLDPTGAQGGPWRHLAMTLALLPTRKPWSDDAESANVPASAYAPRALDRRLKHLLAPGEDLSNLPVDSLHDIRKQAKRLRYAIEFFAPLYAEKSIRKYLPKLEDLQEDFGTLNDCAVAASLVASLGGGADRAFAAGVVQGFGAASSLRAARRLQRGWGRFYRAAPFWD